MNTCVWGPSAWAVLHGIAHAFDGSQRTPRHDDAARNLLTHLGPALPCRYCRESYLHFVPPDKQHLLDLAIANHTLTQFVFDLHNDVSRKLARQRLQPHVAADALSGAVESLLPTLDTVRKRLRVTAPGFCVDDIATMLACMAQNAETVPGSERSTRIAAVSCIIDDLIMVLEVVPGIGEWFAKALDAARQMFPLSLSDTVLAMRLIVKQGLRDTQLFDSVRLFRKAWQERIADAVAHACTHGACV